MMPLRNDLGRAKLIRISLTFFYTLGSKLKPLLNIVPGTALRDVWNTLYDAQSEVQALLETDWFTPAVRTVNRRPKLSTSRRPIFSTFRLIERGFCGA